MIGTEHLQTIVGSNAVDNDGDKLGKIGNVYLDDRTGEPAWATVNTGLFGTKESFVPLATARLEGDQLVVPFDKAKVKDAPKVADDGHIGDDEQEELYRYYGLSSANGRDGNTAGYAGTTDAGTYADGTPASDLRRRHRERLRVRQRGRHGRPRHLRPDHGRRDDALRGAAARRHRDPARAGRARLRKYVVTEKETVTVPVQREEVRIEREPITDANRRRAPSTARRSPRRSTRSCCTRSAPSSRRRPCRWSACASTPRR